MRSSTLSHCQNSYGLCYAAENPSKVAPLAAGSQDIHHRLGGEAVTDRTAAGALLAFFASWTRAVARIATVGLDPSEGGHGTPAALIGFVVLRFRMPLGSGGGGMDVESKVTARGAVD